MKEDKPGFQKSKPVEKVYVKYEPKNNLPTHEATLPNQRYKEDKALTNAICVTNKANNPPPPLHRKRYSDGNLDWGILGSNISNG